MEHEWNLPAIDDGFPRVLRVAEGEPTGDNPEGLLEISGNCSWDDEHLAAEILRLAERDQRERARIRRQLLQWLENQDDIGGELEDRFLAALDDICGEEG